MIHTLTPPIKALRNTRPSTQLLRYKHDRAFKTFHSRGFLLKPSSLISAVVQSQRGSTANVSGF